MMRSLWTGASGMTSQQLNVDTISNNLANVNTTGYKKERTEFQTLLYQTLESSATDANSGIYKPSTMQVGHGVRPVSISRSFQTGSLQSTYGKTDFAIDGQGMFVVQRGDETLYTRDGSFKLSPYDGGLILVTSDGYTVLDTEGEIISLPEDADFSIDEEGRFFLITETGPEDMGIQLEIVQFQNPQGLNVVGRNLYQETSASGEPFSEVDNDNVIQSNIVQGFLEMSNVQVADEMVKLIVAQRAYELNSKSITTSDEMLQQANNLKR